MRQSPKHRSQRQRHKTRAAGKHRQPSGNKSIHNPTYADPVIGTVSHIGDRGDGYVVIDAHGEEIRCHVPRTLPGEVVEFAVETGNSEARIANAKLIRVIEPSPERVQAACRHFEFCGGCQLQHAAPTAIAEFKTERVRRALIQQDLPTDVLAPAITAWGDNDPTQHGRRRMEFAIQHHGQDLKLGLHQPGSNRLIDIAECPVAASAIEDALPDLRELAALALKAGEQADCHVTSTDTGLDIVLTRKREPGLDERLDLPEFLERKGWPRLSWRSSHRAPPETVTAFTTPTITIAGHQAPMPAAGFIQATSAGQDALIDAVMRIVTATGENAYCHDLFCGLGTFTLPLLAQDRNRKVSACDMAGDSLTALRQAAVDYGSRLMVEPRDLFRNPFYADELKGTDCVIFDPPRAGAEAQAEALADSTVQTVIAVSCNPVTFARDARLLIEGGYRMTSVQPVDQFQWSVETELVAAFTR